MSQYLELGFKANIFVIKVFKKRLPFITCLNDVSCPSQVVLVTYCRVCAGRGHNYIGLLCWQQHVSRYQQPAAVSPGETIHLPSELCVSNLVPVTAVWPGPGPGWVLTWFLSSHLLAAVCARCHLDTFRPDRSLWSSAANRSIGSTIGFHNHGEGPY